MESGQTLPDGAFASLMWETGKNDSIVCPKCHCGMVLRKTKKYQYGNGQDRLFFSCSRWPHCNMTVCAHPDGTPMGFPADEETKAARRRAHGELEKYIARTGCSKNAAYRKLCSLLGLTRKEGHIGMFDRITCDRLCDLLALEQGGHTSTD